MGIMIIADPIYRIIEVDDKLKPIIDSKAFQRLRYIKQTALTYLAYPSMNHTRFEHSLGVYYLTKLLANQLDLDTTYYSLVGLLHDIGHCPFSHTGEMALQKYLNKNHEELSYYWLETLKEEIESLGYTINEIYKGIIGENIVTFSLGTDRLDYLQRDSYYSANGNPNINYHYVIKNIVKIDNTYAFREKALSLIEQILILRSHLRKTVYFHKSSLAGDVLLERAITKLLDYYKPMEIALMNDYELVGLFKYYKIGEWERIENRDLPKLLAKYNEENEDLEEQLEKSNINYYKIRIVSKNKIEDIKIYDNEIKPITEVSQVAKYLEYIDNQLYGYYYFVDRKDWQKALKLIQ